MSSCPESLECRLLSDPATISDDRPNLVRHSAAEAAVGFGQQSRLSPLVSAIASLAPRVLMKYFKKEVITSADYRRFVEQAKATRFGISVIDIDGKQFVFIANSAVGRELVKLENREQNPTTKRVIQTNRNQRLLTDNPVAASEDPQSRYGKEQAALFTRLGRRDLKGLLQIIFATDNDSTKIWLARGASELISKQFSQLYFYLLFSPELDNAIPKKEWLANIANVYAKIKTLYNDLEAMTGKHELSIGSLLGDDERASEPRDETIISTFYHVVSGLYGEANKLDESLNDGQKALAIVERMKRHNACVLDVFVPKLVANLDELTEEKALLICHNLLSWLDNSLNISNTLFNLVTVIGADNPNLATQTEVGIQQSILNGVHDNFTEQRALATMFMREVTAPITLNFESFQITV